MENKEYIDRAIKEFDKHGISKYTATELKELAESIKLKDSCMTFTVPTNECEAKVYANTLASTGNYPVGLDSCFAVGVSGGCGVNCFVYQKGQCKEEEEIK